MLDKIHTGELYWARRPEDMAEQTSCLEKLYDFNQTRPSEYPKRAELLKDIPANVVAVGNPCKVIREIEDDNTKALI